MSEPTRPRTFSLPSLALGLAAGLAGALAVGALVISRLHLGAPVPPPAPYTVEAEAVRLTPGAAVAHPFQTAPVQSGPALPRPAETARVTVMEARSAMSFAPLEGRVERVTVVLGDQVKQGQRLVLVRSGGLASMLRELRGSLLEAQTKKSLVDRLKLLVETRAASEHDLLLAQTEYDVARLGASAAEARLRSLAVAEDGDNLYWIVAARTGTVVNIDVQPGQYVRPDRERPVIGVSDLDEVLVLADVPQRDVAGIAPGTVARLHLPGHAGEDFEGKVETVSEVLDPERQTVPVRIRVANQRRQLRPNGFVEAVFLADPARRVLQIPTEAVVSDGLEAVVFVETEPGLFRRREVEIGRQLDERTEIVKGLAAGEKVVTHGALLLLNAIDLQR